MDAIGVLIIGAGGVLCWKAYKGTWPWDITTPKALVTEAAT